MAFLQRGSAAQTCRRARSQGRPLRMGVKRSGHTNPAARRPSNGRFHVNRQVANAFCRKLDPLWVLQITNRWVLTMLARSRPALNQRFAHSRVFPGCGSVGHEYLPEELGIGSHYWKPLRFQPDRYAHPRPARAKKYHTRGGVARKAARIR